MPNKLPYFRFWVKDILGDNRVDAMTAEEFGAYVRLLLMAWQEDPAASLPPDEGLLARWARLDTARWTACRERILACFTIGRDGRHYQKRLREEYEEAVAISEKRRSAGLKGVKARKSRSPPANGQPNGQPNGGVLLDRSGCDYGSLGVGGLEEGEIPRPDFALTAEGLAQQFCFIQRPKRDSPFNVAEHIREELRLRTVEPEKLRDEIDRGDRPKNECWWQLSARFIEKRGTNGTGANRPGVRPVSRIGTPAASLEAVARKTIRCGGESDNAGIEKTNGAHTAGS